ncbi:M48 family metallopeptidase [Colwellia sp. 4_MG-2023]|jgi:predicted Zn-dependent protease|uniref:M48 family metallopeptidase n=1 Tax=unclassified Colwellia TaxID=196834 RepID=UPI0026E1B56E|nr:MULTISPECIES: M48 family metallopeptidase [unclassified Colwellia]MDO6489415.1 M48 family metallopeptidase [Colwellia sp. 6_MG-2023]MDO6507002.1 M48 family metallopeptidase [Colwellia sp. 5_MG-2023]MDO6557198.1 M48 family metallopeptidase [Colwellia sp. 4_MG-2023]
MKYFLIICFALVSLSGCSTSSTGRNQVALYSDSELNKMGVTSFEQMKQEIPISTDRATNDFVLCVAEAIIGNVPESVFPGEWEVVVFDSAQVNAFALPGGKIGVYTGILNVTEDQDQLAAIMGHEVGHVLERHSNERLSASQLSNVGLAVATIALGASDIDNKGLWVAGLGIGVQYGVIMPYSRSHESEADIVGQDLMARSGFAPEASVQLWKNMSKLNSAESPEFMSTHPSNETRIKQLTDHLTVSKPYYLAKKSANTLPKCVKPNVIPKPKS